MSGNILHRSILVRLMQRTAGLAGLPPKPARSTSEVGHNAQVDAKVQSSRNLTSAHFGKTGGANDSSNYSREKCTAYSCCSQWACFPAFGEFKLMLQHAGQRQSAAASRQMPSSLVDGGRYHPDRFSILKALG